jgi:hypothetical protein
MASGGASSAAPTNNATEQMQRAIKIRLFGLAGVDSPDARSQRPVNTGNTALEGRSVFVVPQPRVPAKSLSAVIAGLDPAIHAADPQA